VLKVVFVGPIILRFVWFYIQTSGFEEYQKRRVEKYDKQIGMRTMMSREGFDEGADAQEWQHW
jgi:hypothetical protein